ncbi:hypothetical protein KV102_00025 [Mumia sp. zg.B53]|uniref:DUF6318 family protein n=1 Tax=Mumia sp. zg.B53 TaxID=2855449 RepID=UPI001C6E0021|nr:DUF6318 family protein [Mumia sp. zg.B53]MBW9213211.1 hypothetical protein [Mumia sp. zg.B53]
MTYARAALAGLVLLAVAGCTGGDPAGGDPSDPPSSASPRATPSPTPTLAPPTIPPEAQEHSAQGAAAFVEYYVSLINYAAVSGDTGALAAAATNNCGACARLVERYETIYRDGGTSESPGWRPRVTSSQLVKGDFHVTVDVLTASHRYRVSENAPHQRVKASTYHDIYRLNWVNAQWAVDLLSEQDTPR